MGILGKPIRMTEGWIRFTDMLSPMQPASRHVVYLFWLSMKMDSYMFISKTFEHASRPEPLYNSDCRKNPLALNLIY